MKKIFTLLCICVFFATSFGQSTDSSALKHHKNPNKAIRITIKPCTNGNAGSVTIKAPGAEDYKIYTPDGMLQSEGEINNKGQFDVSIINLVSGTYTITTNKNQTAQFVIL